jgi:enterochelin esterase-like enzyme
MNETLHSLRSELLNNERAVWLRAPRDPAGAINLAIILDAEFYRDRMQVPALLDELERNESIANTLFVFVSHHSLDARWIECPCHPPFAAFINSELLPWLETRHPGISAAKNRVLIGLSYTGLAAAFVALHSSNTFTHVIAQSGSFWWNDCWLTECLSRSASKSPVRFYLDVGVKETNENVRHKEDVLQVMSQIDGVKQFRDMLLMKSYEVSYREFDGAHEFSWWKQTLPDALKWALPSVPIREICG